MSRGYVYDQETGLYYLQSRYYDPEIGRFINADDLVATGQGVLGNNMFVYCLNRPVITADYEGTDAILVIDYKWGRGLPVVGHAYLLVQDKNGNWYKMEFTGNISDKSTARIKVSPVNRSQDNINKMKKGRSAGLFKDYVYISGDFSNSLDYAKDKKTMDRLYNGKYNLVNNNCMHFTRDALLQGDFDSDLMEWTVLTYVGSVPRSFYVHLFVTNIVVQSTR